MNDEERINVMKTYYEKRAPRHDEYMSYSDNQRMEQLLMPIIEIVIPFITDRTVLEIACGTGNWTEVLAKRANSVFAIDSSSTALEIAGKKLERFSNIILKKADAYGLEDISGPFDLVFASDWWSHMPISSIKPFLENLHRNLKRDSRVIFIDMMTREVFENENVYYDSDGNRVSLRTLPDGGEYEVVKNFPSKSDLSTILEGSGNDLSYLEFEALKRWMVTYIPDFR